MKQTIQRPIPICNSILSFMHCGKCLDEMPSGKSPREWGQLEVGFTKIGLQIWCKRHECNIAHIDFQGDKHPACMDCEASDPENWDAIKLSEETRDAYSASAFDSWDDVAKLLKRRGYSRKQAEAIMRSKWVRWCRDAASARTEHKASCLGVWLDKQGYDSTSPEVIALTAEHFGGSQ